MSLDKLTYHRDSGLLLSSNPSVWKNAVTAWKMLALYDLDWSYITTVINVSYLGSCGTTTTASYMFSLGLWAVLFSHITLLEPTSFTGFVREIAG